MQKRGVPGPRTSCLTEKTRPDWFMMHQARAFLVLVYKPRWTLAHASLPRPGPLKQPSVYKGPTSVDTQVLCPSSDGPSPLRRKGNPPGLLRSHPGRLSWVVMFGASSSVKSRCTRAQFRHPALAGRPR